MNIAFKGRREDRRLVTGQGKYTSDWSLPGQLYGAFLRSDHAHADIVKLDVEAALSAPGVKAVVTGADLRQAGVVTPPSRMALPGRNGMKQVSPPRQFLAETKVHYAGQPIALVIADTAFQADDATALIDVEFNDLPVVVDAIEATKPDAPRLYAELPGNLVFDFEFGGKSEVEDIFAKAHKVVDVEIDNTRVVVNPMEPKACLANWNNAAERYELYAGHQGTNFALSGLTSYFAAGPERFRVLAKDVGGSFGTRAPIYPEYVAIMVGSKLVGKPVKWVGTRSETFLSDYHGRSVIQKGRLALDKDGTFLAISHDWLVNAGGYPTEFASFGFCKNCQTGAVGPYRIPKVYGRVQICLSNVVPVGAYRGAGRPETTMLVEQLVDAAALALGMDRYEIRKRNLIARDQFPYQAPQGVTYDSGDHATLVKMVEEAADWAGFEARRKQSAANGKLRGIGCSSYLEGSGGMMPFKDQVRLSFENDGKLVLETIAGASGQGSESTFAKVVSQELGLADDQLIVKLSDPDSPSMTGMGTGGSRAAQVYGSAFTYGAREIIRKGRELAAKQLEAAEQDIEYKEGVFRVAGTDLHVGLTDLAKQHRGALDSMGEAAVETTFPGGAHVAEVEVDPETGVVEFLNYVAVDDCGNAIDHTMVEGQLIGGIIQGVGQVMGEIAQYDENGQLVAGSFMDYFMPRADMVKRMELYDHGVPSPTNVLGAKGVGESGANGALTTAYSAVMDALRQAGVRQMDMPFTPVRVWQAIQQARQA